MMAVCLILNNFSGIGAIVKAATIEQNEINSSLNNNNIEEDMEVDDSVGENESEETIPTLPDNEGSEGDMNGEETPDLNLPGEDNAPSDEEQPPVIDEEAPLEPSEDLEEDSKEDQSHEELEKPEDILLTDEEESQEEIELDEEEVSSLSLEDRGIGSGLVQLWQEVVPGQEWKEGKTSAEILKALKCRPNHKLYPTTSGRATHQTYVNSCYVDDALYLGEDDTHYFIYVSGYEGKVPKSETHTFSADLNGDKTSVNYQINTIARYIPGSSVKSLTDEAEPLDVPYLEYATDTLDKDFATDLVSDESIQPLSEDVQARSWSVQSPSYYANENGTLIHYLSNDVRVANNYKGTIAGKAPRWMQPGVRYYSYDGVYFYLNWQSIRPDGIGAYNVGQPFYNYYQYLPFRSKTQYGATQMNAYTNNNGYYNTGQSKLVDAGQYFEAVQDKFGINGALQYAMGIHESGWGTSAISMNKNNLFGVGANDGNPYGDAQGYPSVENGIYYHAERVVSWGYTDPVSDERYYGAHVGNKGSGMNVKYASDPFWGEKIAGWYYRFDQNQGLRDYNHYSIGIKPDAGIVEVKRQPLASSSMLYRTMNQKSNLTISNYPFIVTGAINGYYQIKTDTPINDLGVPQYSATYSWVNTYGYIPYSSIAFINHYDYTDPQVSSVLQNHVDEISVLTDGRLSLYGWAYLDGLNMNDASTFSRDLVITNQITGTEVRRLPLTSLYATDLTDWNQKPLNYARYEGQTQILDLPSGLYQLDIHLKTDKVDIQSALKSNYAITNIETVINGRSYSVFNTGEGTGITLQIYDLPILNHVDGIVVNDRGGLDLYGWAFYDGINMNDPANFSKEIFLKNNLTGQHIKHTTLTDIYSTDLSDWNRMPLNYARYQSEIDLLDLPSGEYTLFINIKTSMGQKLDVLKSNYAFTDIVSNVNGRRYILSNSGEGTAVTLRVYDLPIQNHIDSVTIDAKGDLNLYGWAMYDGLNMNDSRTFEKQILFRQVATGLDLKCQAVTDVYATDLSEWEKRPLNYARYQGNISVTDLPIGEYLLVINIQTALGGKVDTVKSNYYFAPTSIVVNGRTYTYYNSGEGTSLMLKIS